MKGRDAQPASAVYELTIRGGMGPVIRSALTPHGVSRSEVCTILRAGASGRDLVDLLLLIEEKGLTVEGVFAIEA
jgi:hypothetical protein